MPTLLSSEAALAIDAVRMAGARCGDAHAHVMELEDKRSAMKPDAIKRIMDQGLASSNSAAEKLVESSDPFYIEHRIKQRNAETERWAALAAYEAAKLNARLAVALATMQGAEA